MLPETLASHGWLLLPFSFSEMSPSQGFTVCGFIPWCCLLMAPGVLLRAGCLSGFPHR